MQIVLPSNFKENPKVFLRHCGYHEFYDYKTGKASFVRRLGRHVYPHFHIYIEEEDDRLIFNLHLDQKKPSYAGSSAHSGEYDGELVEKEAERIKSGINGNL